MKRKRFFTVLLAVCLLIVAGAGMAAGCSGIRGDADGGQNVSSTGENDEASESSGEKKAEDEDAGDANPRPEIKDIYDVDGQEEIAEKLAEKKSSGDYDENNMLTEYNPFGTNTQSLYVYFKTGDAVKVSYTIRVEEDAINDFTAAVYQKQEYQKTHEFQLIGLIPDSENTIIFTLEDERGNIRTKSMKYDMGSLRGKESVILTSDIADAKKLEDGLYVVLGNDNENIDFMYYYDNQGVLRGEVPILGYRSHRLLFSGDCMYYSISTTQIARVNRIGQVEKVYTLGKYKLHHDYVFDSEKNILILATDTRQDTEEDIILRLNVKSGKVEEIADMGDLFSDYKAARKEEQEESGSGAGLLDWIHLNSIQWTGDDCVIVSARETSSIIKLKNISSTPEIAYIIGDASFWKGTGYEDLLYEKLGDFTIQGGQHTVAYEEDDSLEEGCYYLSMFNNNIGISLTRKNFDWSSLGLTESSGTDGETSYYYKYLVDERLGTFCLEDSFAVPYSGYVSSVQDIGNNTVVDSGLAGKFGEYDADHNLIAEYQMDFAKFIYRVFKYTFKGFYFAK